MNEREPINNVPTPPDLEGKLLTPLEIMLSLRLRSDLSADEAHHYRQTLENLMRFEQQFGSDTEIMRDIQAALDTIELSQLPED